MSRTTYKKQNSHLRQHIERIRVAKRRIGQHLKLKSEDLELLKLEYGCYFIEYIFQSSQALEKLYKTDPKKEYWLWFNLQFDHILIKVANQQEIGPNAIQDRFEEWFHDRQTYDSLYKHFKF